MNGTPEHYIDGTPSTQAQEGHEQVEDQADEYTPLLLAFGPADHRYEAEGSDDADAYVVGYN